LGIPPLPLNLLLLLQRGFSWSKSARCPAGSPAVTAHQPRLARD